MVGTAEQLTEKIFDAHAELGIARFIGQFDWGGLPPARVRESMARLATEIAPAGTGAWLRSADSGRLVAPGRFAQKRADSIASSDTRTSSRTGVGGWYGCGSGQMPGMLASMLCG
jgi:hypothetical protein